VRDDSVLTKKIGRACSLSGRPAAPFQADDTEGGSSTAQPDRFLTVHPPPLTMKAKSKHYGTLCSRCRLRIRVGRLFVIDPVEPQRIYHADCWRREIDPK
jgi:hypothetical protein